MNAPRPRIPPITDTATLQEIQALLSAEVGDALAARDGGDHPLNVFTTFAQHPELFKTWSVFAGQILDKSTLPTRERELLILRTGWLCRAEYEWAQHAVVGRAAGLSDEELRRITEGPEAPGWSPFDATLLRAADELHESHTITDGTWAALGERYTKLQRIDLVFTCGQYTLVSMALNAFGVQLEEGLDGFPR